MGQQVEMLLSAADEQRLIDHLTQRFPHCCVVNKTYPADWDRRTMDRAEDATAWLIIDDRAVPILLEAAKQFVGDPSHRWQIRSKARSCIEWTRDLLGFGWGRLYLNTTPDPIWLDISAETGDDVERMFRSARAWVLANCMNCSKGRIGIWVSPCKLQEFRAAQAKRDAENIKRQQLDPRDKRYYELQRKKKDRLPYALPVVTGQLTLALFLVRSTRAHGPSKRKRPRSSRPGRAMRGRAKDLRQRWNGPPAAQRRIGRLPTVDSHRARPIAIHFRPPYATPVVPRTVKYGWRPGRSVK